jgi:hypothetical protein
MSTPSQSRRWLWVTPVLLVAGLIVNMRNPHLTPGVRMVWWFVLLPGIMIMVGYGLYVGHRRRRSRRPISWVWAVIILGLWGLVGGVMVWWLTY